MQFIFWPACSKLHKNTLHMAKAATDQHKQACPRTAAAIVQAWSSILQQPRCGAVHFPDTTLVGVCALHKTSQDVSSQFRLHHLQTQRHSESTGQQATVQRVSGITPPQQHQHQHSTARQGRPLLTTLWMAGKAPALQHTHPTPPLSEGPPIHPLLTPHPAVPLFPTGKKAGPPTVFTQRLVLPAAAADASATATAAPTLQDAAAAAPAVLLLLPPVAPPFLAGAPACVLQPCAVLAMSVSGTLQLRAGRVPNRASTAQGDGDTPGSTGQQSACACKIASSASHIAVAIRVVH